MNANDKVFDNYDEAQKYSLTIPWELQTCNVGEECWCRIILPTEKILYKNKIGDSERVDEFEYIIPDGSIDKETAEYFLELHHASLNAKKAILDNMENIRKINWNKEIGGQQVILFQIPKNKVKNEED